MGDEQRATITNREEANGLTNAGGTTTFPSTAQHRFAASPFQAPPPLHRSVPFISTDNPYSLSKPQCMHVVLTDLQLLSNAVLKAGVAVKDAGLVASPMYQLATFLTDSFRHLHAYLEDANTNSGNERGLEDIVVKVLLDQLAVTARTLEVQCRQISEYAAHLAKQAKRLDEKQFGIDEVVDKAASSIRLEKRALDMAAEELERKVQLASDHLASSKISVVPGRDENAALLVSQREQLRLQKLLSQRQLELKGLREQHQIVKSEMLSMQRCMQHAQHEMEVSKRRAHKDIQDLRERCAAARDQSRKAQALAATERQKRHQQSVALAKQQQDISRMRDCIRAEKTLRTQIKATEQQNADLSNRCQKLKKVHDLDKQRISQMEAALEQRAVKWVKQKHQQQTTEELQRWKNIMQHQEALKQNSQSHLRRQLELNHRTTEQWKATKDLSHDSSNNRSKSVHLPVLHGDENKFSVENGKTRKDIRTFPERVRTRLQRVD
ncbi:myosin-2-like isoform X2 [Corticium candelabrum]|uniref:myosin-2-like isoform X2 n=1 Tax=Corticium candelabrum TaxID=121492 RepID=UPI002E25BF9E|nr:myosin-2-like isoform X2 [Corticium candelabrum]